MEPLPPSFRAQSPEFDDESRALLSKAFETTYPTAMRTDVEVEAWVRQMVVLEGREGVEERQYGRDEVHTLFGGQSTVSRPWKRTGVRVAVFAMILLTVIVSMTTRPSRVMGVSYTTGAGQRATVALGDGSHITLAPSTTLRIDALDRHSTRIVELSGEGYFEIVDVVHAPFIVRAGATSARVLGTAFDVRRYADDDRTTVTVREGRVSVMQRGVHGSPRVLDGGVSAQLADSGVTTIHSNVSVDDVVAWIHGNLVFNNAMLRDAIPELARAYDLEIRVSDSTLATRRFTFVMNATPVSARGMLNALSTLVDACYSRAGRIVTLVPAHGGCRGVLLTPSTKPEVQYGR